MKMTLHIDESLLEEVMAITGARTKTRAIEMALREMTRRHKMKRFFSATHAVPAADWADAWAIWDDAAAMAWHLDRRGRVLPAQDHVIAACALSVGAAVLTSDAHFQGIPKLTVYDPPQFEH